MNHFLEIFNGDGLFLQPHIQRQTTKSEEDGTSGAVGFEEEGDEFEGRIAGEDWVDLSEQLSSISKVLLLFKDGLATIKPSDAVFWDAVVDDLKKDLWPIGPVDPAQDTIDVGFLTQKTHCKGSLLVPSLALGDCTSVVLLNLIVPGRR